MPRNHPIALYAWCRTAATRIARRLSGPPCKLSVRNHKRIDLRCKRFTRILGYIFVMDRNYLYQRGNVLFIVLITVALFAALCYAVSITPDSGQSIVLRDKAHSYASQIVQQGAALRGAIMRMKVINGCTDTMFDFTNNAYKKNSGALVGPSNVTSPIDKRCHVYNSAGGGVSPVIPPAGALDFDNLSIGNAAATSPGSGRIYAYQIKGIGTDDVSGTESANDLVFFISYLNRETCKAINDLMGLENPDGEPGTSISSGTTGGYVNGSLAATAIREYPGASGQPSLCFSAADGYTFMQVLIER